MTASANKDSSGVPGATGSFAALGATGSFPALGSTGAFPALGSTGSFAALGSTGALPSLGSTGALGTTDALGVAGSTGIWEPLRMATPRPPRKPLVIFSAQFLPNYGGVEQFVATLAHTLAAQGQRVVIVAANNYDAAESEALEPGVDVLRLPCHGRLGDRLARPKRNAAFRRLWAELMAYEPAGVLVNNLFYPHTLLGLEYARDKGLRAVLLSHASSYLSLGSRVMDMPAHAYEHMMADRVRAFDPVCYGVSERASEWLGTFGFAARGVLHNAVDAAGFRALSSGRDFRAELGISESTLVATFTGRLIREKGVDVLDQAARLLDARHAPVRILVAGDGPELPNLIRPDHPRTLVALGRLPREDISALLQQSDLFCFPSRYPEGLPTSLLEAGACGLTAVATDVGGVREVMPSEEYGVVLDDATPVDVAAAIVAYIGNRDVLALRGERVRERVEQVFSWERTAADVRAACELAQHT